MKRILMPLLFIASPALAQSAPFCVVTGAGSQCHYWSAPSCESAARSMRGMCVVNQEQQQAQPGLPNLYESWTRARDGGARRAEQAHKPIAAVAQPSNGKFDWDGLIKNLAYRQHMRGPIYDCGDGPTPVPSEGCTVVGFERDP